MGLFDLWASQLVLISNQHVPVDDQSLHRSLPAASCPTAAAARVSSASGELVGIRERHVGQLLLAAHALSFALVEFPGAAMEDLGLCRVASLGKRDHRLIGAAGEGRLLTCCD